MAQTRPLAVNLYEGLFLLDQNAVSADFAGAVEHVREMFKRADAELILLRKWEERRLAYEIKGQKRGTYLLAYFRCQGPAVAHIERDVNLSEQVLRAMLIKADHIGDVELELAKKDADLTLETKLRAVPVRPAELEPASAAADHSDGDADDR